MSRISVKNRDRFAQPKGNDERGEVLARRHIPFPRADENPAPLAKRPGEIPAPIMQRIRRRDKPSGSIKGKRFRRRGQATVRRLHDRRENALRASRG